jgi:uncharacterized DUF497 family protein
LSGASRRKDAGMGSFEWDEAKDAANRMKHGISFGEVISIFEGPILTIEDTSHNPEVRELSFGLLAGMVVVCVVHTQRSHKTRIISARKATRAERKMFDDYLKKAYS